MQRSQQQSKGNKYNRGRFDSFSPNKGMVKMGRYSPCFRVCKIFPSMWRTQRSILPNLTFPRSFATHQRVLSGRLQGLSSQIHPLLHKALPSKLTGGHRDGGVWGISLKSSIEIFSNVCKKSKNWQQIYLVKTSEEHVFRTAKTFITVNVNRLCNIILQMVYVPI